MNLDLLPKASKELALKLSEISNLGPIPSIGKGDTAVGMTLLHSLGVPYSSRSKPNYKGVVISARRGTKHKDLNRVNLFAKVPSWKISRYKSSRDFLERFGYVREGVFQLNCTVSTRQKNSQGLILELDKEHNLLNEVYISSDGGREEIVSWEMHALLDRLLCSHSASVWVVAIPSIRGGVEHFHFRYATFTDFPSVDIFPNLIEQGTITVDHLLSKKKGRVVEKGPLFKIKPGNVGALLPIIGKCDLLSLG